MVKSPLVRHAICLFALLSGGVVAAGAARAQSASVGAAAEVVFPGPVVEMRLGGALAGVRLAGQTIIPVRQSALHSRIWLDAGPGGAETRLSFSAPTVLLVGPYSLVISPRSRLMGAGHRRGALREHPISEEVRSGGTGRRYGSDNPELCVQVAKAYTAPSGPGDLPTTITLTVSYTGT